MAVIQPAIPLFYSRKEAAKVLRLSLRSIAYLIAHGQIQTRKIGGRRLVLVDSLCAYARKDHPRAIAPTALVA